MRKICVVSGTRAEYGLLKPIMDKIKAHDSLELQVIVTGMHLLQDYGYTITQIEKDGFKIDGIAPMYEENEQISDAIANGIKNISQILKKISPEILLLLGDRTEVLAAAIVATYLQIPIAHIHGGDQSEDGAHIDDIIRPVISKFSHIHFPATEQSAERIRKIGEENSRIRVVGAPGLDNIKENLISPEELAQKFNFDLSKPILLVLQHPVPPNQSDQAGQQMEETMKAIKQLEQQTVLLYPNNDPGSEKIIEVIKKYEQEPFIKTFKNLPRDEYRSLLNIATVMIGNSSSATIEAPAFKLPVVNIGIRESKRESANNKIFVPPDHVKIKEAIEKAMTPEFKKQVENCTNPWGDGNASKKIINVLANIEINKKLIQKVIK